MCLFFPSKLNQTDDITCYKVCNVIDHCYYSPYQKELYRMGSLKSINNINDILNNTAVITYNAFHSFQSEQYAINYINDANLSHTVIIKCIIPKNSNYTYKGFFMDMNIGKKYYDSYASEKLLPVSVVKEFTVENYCRNNN